MKKDKYPVRCEIVDVTGFMLAPDLVANTPDVSKPHVGKFGLAEKLEDGNVRITLDDGSVLFGYECWWTPIDNAAGQHLTRTEKSCKMNV